MNRIRARSRGAAPFAMARPRTRRFEDTPLGFLAMTLGLLAGFALIVYGLPILAMALGARA
jgi:hypothetical protein